MKFERGKLYLVDKIAPGDQFGGNLDDVLSLFRVTDLRYVPGKVNPIVQYKTSAPQRFQSGQVFMFLNFESSTVQDQSNEITYLILLFGEYIWTTNFPVTDLLKYVSFKRLM